MPAELRPLARWLVWLYVWRPATPTKPGKWDKPPHRSDGAGLASSTDPSTWSTVDAAWRTFEASDYDGIGFVIGEGIVGVDIDGCRDPDTGELTPEAQRIVAELSTYTEVSPSSTGIRAFAFGELPPKGRKRGTFEMYDGDGGRYLTVTGHQLDGTPDTIEHRTAELATIHARHIARPERPKASANGTPRPATGTGRHLSDTEVLDAMKRNRRNGPELARLYDGDTSAHDNDHSAADMALAGALAWWCDGDGDQVDRLMRASGLMRDKWDRPARQGETYGAGTIREALEGHVTGTGYQGRAQLDAAELGPPPRDETDPGPEPIDAEPKAKPRTSKGEPRKPSGAPDVVRAPRLTRLSSVAPEAVEHLDDGRLALGKLTLLVGDAGIGKTHIALALAANVTKGRPIFPPGLSPSASPRAPSNVLAFIGEDGLADTIRTRFDDADGDPDRFYALTDVLTTSEGRVLEGEVDLTQLDVIEQALLELRPSLVIVDPIQVYMGAGVDMHRANEVRATLKGIAKLAAKYHASLLVLAHLNKGTGKALYRALGSIDFVAIARSVLVAGIHDGEPALAHAKANLSARAPTLTYTLERGRLEWTGTTEANADDLTSQAPPPYERPREAEAADWLTTYLLNGPRRSSDVAEAAKRADIAVRTLRRAADTLGVAKRRVGSAGADGHWVWELPDA